MRWDDHNFYFTGNDNQDTERLGDLPRSHSWECGRRQDTYSEGLVSSYHCTNEKAETGRQGPNPQSWEKVERDFKLQADGILK